MATAKKVVKKVVKKAAVAAPTVKHVLISSLGESAQQVSVEDNWTLSDLISRQGIDNASKIIGIKANGTQTELSPTDIVNGYTELVVVAPVRGGN
jgi:hypothetical protein